MKPLLLALTLAACASSAVPPEATIVPIELRSCPLAPAAVPVPAPPRNFDTVLRWSALVDRRRAETASALATCRARLHALGNLIDAQRENRR
jgi:hypothetical protein